ncbi:hypothetical protein QQS21_003599 [Conoideocrella luteorostrata]|uniref:Uncharacterized protein n=1 Tax=Conoideocrella luteorostrata TaxID=1105319 RepID=A0AAJ0FW80_9HYPO|nr:hypothetical protein QQS21_003599 [Conoideocrella luteorostrata]
MHLPTLLSFLPLALAGPTPKRSEPAPLIIPRGEGTKLVPNEYIIKFKKGSALESLQGVVSKLNHEPYHVFDSIFKGFAGKLDPAMLETIRGHPDVDFVEQNVKFHTTATVTQNNAPWGLGRISHKRPGSSSYVFDDSAGAGTCAYIVDTGIDYRHADFEGRAKLVKVFNGDSNDNCGHGSHVAGTIGGKTYGVAKKTNLYSIKVLEYNPSNKKCEGSNDVIIAGLDYISKDAASRSCPKGIVVNMSLGGDYSQASNNAVAALVKRGYFVAVAAGNGDARGNPINAQNVSPASEKSACTIGATDSSDRVASFSNYGSLVDLHGPGVSVVSVRAGGGYTTMSGTSMATPHVAGLGAYFLGLGKPANNMCQYLQSVALKNNIQGLHSGTSNLLAQNGIGA